MAHLSVLLPGPFQATRPMVNSLIFFAEMTGWSTAILPYFEEAAAHTGCIAAEV